MTDISKENADTLSHGDLILLCEKEGIKVSASDNADSLRAKLTKKPKAEKED